MTHGFKGNRKKYQDNELIKDLQLNLMNFQARQYDPQIGRFLSVDPMAAFGGQDMFSPYAAMGNTLESNVDPNGLMPTDKSKFGYGYAYLDFASTEGSRGGGGATSGSGQGRDFWADGGFGRDSYGSISGFGNGMDAGVARWNNAQAVKNLVSFVNAILNVNTNQNFSYSYETGTGSFWGGSGSGSGYNPFALDFTSTASRRDRRWRDRNYYRKTNGSPFDERGRELLGRWLEGSGNSMNTVDGVWGEYMKSNSILSSKIKGILASDAVSRVAEGSYTFSGSAEIENGYYTGYQMLHGTDATVGGFQIKGYALMGTGGKSVQYILSISWHDKIDPNPKYQDDVSYSNMLKSFYSPKDYDVHIYWTQIITIYRK